MEKIILKIKEKLAEIIEDSSIYQFDESLNFMNQYELSSLQIVQLLVNLEEEFAIEFDIEELGDGQFESISKLAQSVNNHIEQRK